ncbi:unnamed protein product [Heterobilharzia americana]|nr:unnamed protein product [Heterobilharzia americana]
MSINSQYTHTTTPILEAWLIKALRLIHSRKASDRDKLPLREPREVVAASSESTERNNYSPIHSTQRIRMPQSINETNSHIPSGISTTPNIPITIDSASMVSSDNSGTLTHITCTINSDQPVGSSINSSTTTSLIVGNVIHSSLSPSNSTAFRGSKRNKVAFFNIFDIASPASSSSGSSTSTSNTTAVLSKNNTQRPSNQLDNSINIDSVDPATTVQLCPFSSVTSTGVSSGVTAEPAIGNSNSSNNIIDLTLTDNDGPSISSSSTSSTVTASINPPLIEDCCSKDNLSNTRMNSTYMSTVTTPSSSIQIAPVSAGTNIVINSKQDTSSMNNSARLLAASLVADLVCRICGRLSQQPQLEMDKKTMNANVLVECIKCGSLYHQLCHQPVILMSMPKQQWMCMHCSTTTATTTSADLSLSSPVPVVTLTVSSDSSCSITTDPVISSNLIRSHSILSSDVTIVGSIPGDNNLISSGSSSYSIHQQSLILSDPVQFSSSSASSVSTTLTVTATTTATTTTTNASTTSNTPTQATTTITVGARKRKPAFTSPLSGIPRKLKDEHN